jgi:hypothetical protein
MSIYHFRAALWRVALLFVLITLTLAAPSFAQSTPTAPKSPNALFLPALQNGVASTPNPIPGPTPKPPKGTPAAYWLPFTTQDASYVGTMGTNIAVDGRGGIHIVYTIDLNEDNGARPAYYVYCPADCGKESQWTRVRLDDGLFDARLQLDAQGHPRLMLYVYTGQFMGAYPITQYHYAQCDQSCSDAANWTITPIEEVVVSEPFRKEAANHYFALDAQGHPAFVFADSSDHRGDGGEFLVACRQADISSCSDVQNWTETRLLPDILYRPELAFSGDGLPRILVETIDRNASLDKLIYIECSAADCTQGSMTQLYNGGAFDAYSLRLDSQDRPRFVFYTGEATGNLEQRQLYYAWCDGACTDAASWQAADLHTHLGFGWSVDLALDPDDHPHFVYKMGDAGPGYAWCDGHCESDNGQWHSTLVEGVQSLEQTNPLLAVIGGCTESHWASGYLPQLVLDANGDALLSYNAVHTYTGKDARPDHLNEDCGLGDAVGLSRFVAITQP